MPYGTPSQDIVDSIRNAGFHFEPGFDIRIDVVIDGALEETFGIDVTHSSHREDLVDSIFDDMESEMWSEYSVLAYDEVDGDMLYERNSE